MNRLDRFFKEEEEEEEKIGWAQRMRGISELPKYELPKLGLEKAKEIEIPKGEGIFKPPKIEKLDLTKGLLDRFFEEKPEIPLVEPEELEVEEEILKPEYGIPPYSATLIAKQLKEKTYIPVVAEEIEKGNVFAGTIATFGVMLTKIPKQVAVGVLQAAQGKEGASVVNRDWADEYIKSANEDIEGFVKEAKAKYGNKSFMGLKITDLAELPQNIGFSVTSMGAGLAVGAPISLIPLPGARAAAYIAGTAASGKVAYDMTTYQIMQQYLEIKNDESVATTGKGITLEEENKLKKEFDRLAHQYGLWEAIPEAISNLAFFSILTAPLTKMVGKGIAGQIVTRISGLYGEELLTETITQMGQANIEVQAGMREEEEAREWFAAKDWIKSLKEVAPQTFLLTTLMAGAGTTIIKTKEAFSKAESSLKNEIGERHPLYNKLLDSMRIQLEDLGYLPEEAIALAKEEVPLPGELKKDYLKTIGEDIKFVKDKIELTKDIRQNIPISEELQTKYPDLMKKIPDAKFAEVEVKPPVIPKERVKPTIRGINFEEHPEVYRVVAKADDIIEKSKLKIKYPFGEIDYAIQGLKDAMMDRTLTTEQKRQVREEFNELKKAREDIAIEPTEFTEIKEKEKVIVPEAKMLPEVKKPMVVPMATKEQKAKAHIIAKDSKLITTTPSGKISDIRYRRVAKAITGKTTMKKMTEAEADEFIEAMKGVVQRRPWEPPIIPLSTKIVPKEFFEIEFREPTVPKYITPKDYLLREIGAEDLVKDVTEAHRVAYLEGIKINNWVDKIVREINKKAPIGQKLKRAILAKPTDRLTKFRDLLDTYKIAPDFLDKADQKIFTQLRRFTKKMLDDTNKVRGKLGLDLIKEVEAYIPHFVDELTKQIVNKKYPFPEDVKYWLGRNMPKKIYNPTAMERRVKEDLNKFFSKDLGALLKTLAKYDLRDVYLSEPYSVMRASLNALGDRIPANVRREIDDYMKYDIFSYPDNLDTLFNATVKIPIDVINKFLKPFGRVITNPARSISNLTRRFVLLGAIWSRPKLVIRNLGQRLLIMDLYQPKYFLKAQLTKMPRENWAEIKDTTFYKISRRFEDIPEGIRKIERWGLKPYQLSHVGNEYLSNVDVAMKSGYYYAQDMVELSEDKNSGFYKYAERYAKKHDIPLDKLLWTEEDIIAEAEEAGSLSQWLYFTTGMPQVFRGYLKRAAFTLQSWSMNYLTKHLRESYTRTKTNRTSRGKLMRPIDRLNWLKGTAIIIGILWGLREAFDFSYERYLLPWGIVLNTNILSPVGQILGGAFNYVTARNDWEKTKALKQVRSAWKVFVPGSLAWKDAKAFLNGEISLKEYLFYIEWKEKEKKVIPSIEIEGINDLDRFFGEKELIKGGELDRFF